MLRLEGLTAAYGPVIALDDVSLDVAEGEIATVLGANGAGKTTLLRTISGLVRARSGRVLLDGREIGGAKVEEIVRLGVAHVPEGRGVIAELTVEENLRLGFAGRRTHDGIDEDVAWVHELFPIVAEFRGRQAGALSGGQQQQLAIARALVARPDLLLLDEPSLGLAPQLVDTVFDVLRQIRERGVTVLLVEQRAQRTVAFADRTYVLANGELVTTLGPKDASDTERLIAAYLGRGR